PPPRGPVEARYEIILTKAEVDKGTQRILTRNNKKLQVKIPAGTKNGAQIRLRNALQITNKRPGDIIITVNVK
ncbi:MAG: J domain-containing protein, partial [Chloroflexi bacterium]|nr:J domain-containing protein [Chloroflexota bacterium]